MPEVLPAQPRSFWHDHDLDGDIDASDLAHLDDCTTAGLGASTSDWWCVLVHDRDGDRREDAADEEAFWLWGDANYDSQGTPAPAEWERSVDVFTARARLDADGDGRVDLYDFAGLQECPELPCSQGDTECEALGDCCRLVYDVDGSRFVGSADVAAYADAMGGPDQPRVAAGSAGGFGGSGGFGGAGGGVGGGSGGGASGVWMPGWSSRFGNPFAFTGQRLDPLTGLYHFWARSYDPRLGRFLQADLQGPLNLIDVFLPSDGYAPSVSGISPYSGGEYADGMNLWRYARGNPTTWRDPLGLDSWDDEIDDITSELAGQRIYAIGAINEGAKWASFGLNFAMNLAWGFLPGSGLYDAFQAVEVLSNGGGGFWDALDIALVAFPAAKMAGNLVGMRSLFKANKFKRFHCNCFAAGTEVDTPAGAVPIEELQPGDEVLARAPDAPGDCPRPARITRVFQDVVPLILWLTLANGQVLGVTPDHEVWGYEHGWTTARALEVGKSFVDADGQPVAVVDVAVEPSPTPVYNLEVAGDHTYFAAGVWVHNNSCKLLTAAAKQKHHLFPQQFRKWFADHPRNINIDDYIMELDETAHLKGVHGKGGFWGSGGKFPVDKWNDRWESFTRTYPNADAKKTYQFLGQLMDEFGLSGSYVP